MKVLTLIIASAAAIAVTGMKAPQVFAADAYPGRGYVEEDRYIDEERFRYRGAGLKDDYEPIDRADKYHSGTKDNYVDDDRHAHRRHDRYGGYEKRRRLGLHTPGIHRRLERQKKRVVHGVERGDLTPREIRAIRDCIEDIRYQLKEARYDGHVTRRERFKIHAMLDDSSHLIKRLKHNRRFVRADY